MTKHSAQIAQCDKMSAAGIEFEKRDWVFMAARSESGLVLLSKRQ